MKRPTLGLFAPALVAPALFSLCLVALLTAVGSAKEPSGLQTAKLGGTRNVHTFGSTILCGQPSPDDLELARQHGIQVVLTLRDEQETDWDEESVVKQLGLDFQRVAFGAPGTLTDEVFTKTRKIMRDAKQDEKPLMLHCASANRVGAIWIAYRVLDEGVELPQAEQEALKIGLRSEANHERTLQYIKQMQQAAQK